mgnify:CR=1 FL=1
MASAEGEGLTDVYSNNGAGNNELIEQLEQQLQEVRNQTVKFYVEWPSKVRYLKYILGYWIFFNQTCRLYNYLCLQTNILCTNKGFEVIINTAEAGNVCSGTISSSAEMQF